MKRTMKLTVNSSIVFGMATLGLVAIIAFCVAGTVMGKSDMEARELEGYYREKEAQLLQDTKAFLTEMGYANSGVTLTRVVDQEGKRDYTFTIHHYKIDRMSEEERGALADLLLTKSVPDENCKFYHEFLMYE